MRSCPICAGFGGHFPLAELSLEGNPIEVQVILSISNALQQLSPLRFWPSDWKLEKDVKPGSVPKDSDAALTMFPSEEVRRTQSQPTLATWVAESEAEIDFRKALSEGDVEDTMDFRPRAKTIKEFQEDLQILSAFIEARFPGQRRVPLERAKEVSSEESGILLWIWPLRFWLILIWHVIFECLLIHFFWSDLIYFCLDLFRVQLLSGQKVFPTSLVSGMDLIATIPDMGMDFGFGPPVPHGTYSHTDTPPDTSVLEATEHDTGWEGTKWSLW